MSYDLEIWSVNPVHLPAYLPNPKWWDSSDGSYTPPSKDWSAIIGESDRVQSEDIPEDIKHLLPGIRFMTEVNVSFFNTASSDLTSLQDLAISLAKHSRGVIYDPQDDSITTASGIKSYRKDKPERVFSVLELSWWFTDSPILQTSGVEKLLRCFETKLPEAMPRRYGLYEPPQYTYASARKAHFTKFIRDNKWNIVWYASKPVLDVEVMGISGPWGPTPRGFRVNNLSITIEAAAVNELRRQTVVKEFWHALSKLIVPFYADVRILDGYIITDGRLFVGPKTQANPISGPWWAGMDSSMGIAAVLGEPYLSVWPEFRQTAKIEEGLAFIELPDWAKKGEVSTLIGGVPEKLRYKEKQKEEFIGTARVMNAVKEPAEVWPFKGFYSKDWPK